MVGIRVLVAYSSITGNTEKVAKSIYDSIVDDYSVDLRETKDCEISDLEKYDVILAGFWIDRAYPDIPSKKFLANIRNKKVGLFGTIGADPDSYHGKRTMSNLDTVLDESNQMIAKFLCNGKVDEKLIRKLKSTPRDKMPPGVDLSIMRQMIETGEKSREPNQEDLENASKLFKEALESLEN